MNAEQFCGIARRLLSQPAAPYFEHEVRAEVQRICGEHGLGCRQDEFGNLIVRLRTTRKRRPMVLAAHLDHPGFELRRQLTSRKWLATFRGGVPDPFFRPGLPIRLMPGSVPARLGRRYLHQSKTFELHSSSVTTCLPTFGVWEMKDFSRRNGRIYARSCDDLVGVAVVLATLIGLKRVRARVDVIGAVTRAEEVGFHGALALASSGKLPRQSLVISLETSRELPGVQMGRGPILRVGDRASVFDSKASRFLAEVAGDLATTGFPFQRALMSGGTCEATAYQELGFQSAALCVALGNYHNCGPRWRIQPEYVSVDDALGMVKWLKAAATQMPRFQTLTNRLPHRLAKLLNQARPRLQRTALDHAPRGR